MRVPFHWSGEHIEAQDCACLDLVADAAAEHLRAHCGRESSAGAKDGDHVEGEDSTGGDKTGSDERPSCNGRCVEFLGDGTFDAVSES